MEVNIDEAFAAIEGYVLEPSLELRLRIADSEADFERFEAQYRTTRMSADEERCLEVINAAFLDAVVAGEEIVSLTDRLIVALERFEANLEETDRILDEEIQPLILSETERAVVDARLSGNITLGATVAGMDGRRSRWPASHRSVQDRPRSHRDTDPRPRRASPGDP